MIRRSKSIEQRGAEHAKRHNKRVSAALPLLAHAGLVEQMSPERGAERVQQITRDSEANSLRRLHASQALEAAAYAAMRAEFAPEVAEVAIAYIAFAYPLDTRSSALARLSRKLRAGRPLPPFFTCARYWLPRPEGWTPADQEAPTLRLVWWTGDAEVFGDARDPEAHARCDAYLATLVELADTFGPSDRDPLSPVWIDLPEQKARKCQPARPASRLQVVSLRARHAAVMRHLRTRSPLPGAP